MEPQDTDQLLLTTSETPTSEPQRTRPPRFALWRNQDYMLLWSGQIVSNVGAQASTLAFPLLILTLTGSPALAGLAGTLRALPYLLFSLPAGALIDRWDRKRVMIICDVGRTLAMASIPLAFVLGQLTIIQIFVATTIEGALFVFFNIAEAACLPRVVPKSLLPEATAQNMATDGITTLLGPPIGGLLYQIGNVIPFLADAVSYACSVLSLFFIKTNFQEERIAVQRSLWIEIHEGLRWLWHNPLIRFMAILTGGNNLISAGLTLVIIVLAQQMHASSFSIGLIFAIGGIGAIGGALIGPLLQKRLSFGVAIISMMWIMALSMPLYSIAPNIVIIGIVMAVSFVGGSVYNVVQFSYRSAIIPDELQGRVNSVFRLIAFGGQPLGYALIGLLIQDLGVTPTILIASAVLIALAVATTLNTHIRHAQPLAS